MNKKLEQIKKEFRESISAKAIAYIRNSQGELISVETAHITNFRDGSQWVSIQFEYTGPIDHCVAFVGLSRKGKFIENQLARHRYITEGDVLRINLHLKYDQRI